MGNKGNIVINPLHYIWEWNLFWSGGLTKGSLMFLHQEVWVSISGEDRIMRIKREKAYKRSAAWRKEYR